MFAPVLALALVSLVLGLVPASTANAGTPSAAVCAGADAALAEGELEKARDAYLDLLASDEAASCATRGLTEVTTARRAEKRLCEEGKKLTEAGEEDEARQRYVAALKLNVSSACAAAGLGAAPSDDSASGKDGLEQTEADVTALLKIIGGIVIGILVVVAFGLLLLMQWRRRKPSLAVEPFDDAAVDAKVGGVVAGLVQKRLLELSKRRGLPRRRGRLRRRKRADDSYRLDVVVADVELLASNESLETALGGLAEASQLTLVAALFSLVDKLFNNHFVAKGNLAPYGVQGRGLVLGLQSQKKGLQSQGALWLAGSPPKSGSTDTDPSPYYKLADQAAAWIQYEAARGLDSRVELFTTDARSFSLVAEGLAAERAGQVQDAAERYAEALMAEPGNVAALVNLSSVLARYGGFYTRSLRLLEKADEVLRSRYAEIEE